MKLFLASEAKHPESIEKLSAFVGGFNDKEIVYIPTAANGEYWGAWKTSQSIRVAQSLGASVKIIQLEEYYQENILEAIGQPDIIWMAGGMAGYLLYWMRRVGFDEKLPELLNQGTIYVGSSAGSMVCGPTQFASAWNLQEPERGADLMPGLGLVDFEIYPHFETTDYGEIEKRWEKGKLCLLKNGEVITVVEGKTTVLGQERFIVK